MSRFRNVASQIYALTATSKAKESLKSHRLMQKAGLIRQTASGVYTLLPAGLRALNKLQNLVDEEMSRIGGLKLEMGALVPKALWSKSGRWDVYGDELWRLKDRKGSQFCLGPTHEEVVTELASTIRSYRALPLKMYQITRKFRDELRPRGGLLRAREFLMKDMYSFDVSPAAAEDAYRLVTDAYEVIFQRLRIPFIKADGDTGPIGGTLSHEYHVPAECGEDNVLTCTQCSVAINKELLMENSCLPRCKAPAQCKAKTQKGIEVGHAFYLGTKYSDLFQVVLSDSSHNQVTAEMGCYGIGITRLLQACIEVLSPDNETQIQWPELIAPYKVCILPMGKEFDSEAEELYDDLTHSQVPCSSDVILEDRHKLSASARLSQAKLLGYPYLVILGKSMQENGLFELQAQSTGGHTEFLPKQNLINKIL